DTATIAVAVALATVYATLRYNIFKGVAWSDCPHFVGNKIVAVSALILIVDAIWRLASRDRRPIRRIMGTASLLAVVHSLKSLALLVQACFVWIFFERGDSLDGGV